MSNSNCNFILRALLLALLTLGLAACGGSSGGTGGGSPQITSGSASTAVFGGSVGDGPVTGAAVNVISRKGHSLGTIFSDRKARYQARITPTPADYPLRLVATGGIDLVTGKKPDFSMESVVISQSETVVNINPFTTLITLVAKKLPGGMTPGNTRTANSLVMGRLSFGLNKSAVPDTISTPITARNIAQLVKASEALGEAVRRTRDQIRASGQNISGDAVMAALAADMTDGHPDGLGRGGTNATVTAVFNVVTGQVLVELLSNNLRVGGVIATGVLDQSIKSTLSGVGSNQLTGSVRVTAEVLAETRVALAAVQVLDGGAAVANIASKVNGLKVNATSGSVAQVLPSGSTNSLNNAVNRAPNATTAQVNAINQTVFAQADTGSGSSNTVPAGSGSTDTGSGSTGSGSTGSGSTGTGSTGSTGSTGTGSTGSGGSGTVSAGNSGFSLRWTAPLTRADGSPLSLSAIGGYRIYYGTSSGNYPNVFDKGNGSSTSASVNNLASGKYYLAMTTYDTTGLESRQSPEVIKNAP